MVEEKLKQKIHPSKIGYFSFTRKASEEAVERATKKFNLDKQSLVYFRTLHSLACYQLGLPRGSLMKNFQYKKFGEAIGIHLNHVNLEEENGIVFTNRDTEFLTHIDSSRAKNISLKEQWKKNARNIQWLKLEWLDRQYKKYKKNNTLYDYTDMLVKFVECGISPSLDFLFIDEAQDLSYLQWQAVEKLALNAKETYIAGDDDQAIFRWASADEEHFINMKGKSHTLKQSHRVPKKVHPFSIKLLNRIRDRRQKEYFPRDYEGILKYHRSYIMDISKGEWLILATTNYILDKIEENLIERGILFKRKNKSSVSTSVISAINNWEKLKKGKKFMKKDIKKIYNLMSENVGYKQKFKNLETMPILKTFSLQDLIKNYGLLRQDSWKNALDRITIKNKVYIASALRKKEKLSSPRVRISTIHGAKGSECDNVVLLTDLSRKAEQQAYRNSDDLTRTMYVGATRAKKALHVVTQQTTRGFPL